MNSLIEVVDVYDLGASGDGVARLPNGAVVFVPGGLPGDRVEIRVGRKRKGVHWGKINEYIEYSSDRVEPLCHEIECGGCQLKALSTEKQEDIKYRRVIEAVRRIGGIEAEELLVPLKIAADTWHYRHRVRFHCRWKNRRWRLGFFARKSHKLLALKDCPVLWPELLNAAHTVENLILQLPQEVGLDEIEIVYSRRDGKAAAFVHAKGDIEPCRELLAALPADNLVGIDVVSGEKERRLGRTILRYDHAQADNFDLFFAPGVFTQAFPAANDRLVESVCEMLRPEMEPRILELHAGIGNFSTALARQGALLQASEIHPAAALFCQRNLRALGKNAQVLFKSDVEAWQECGEGLDAVLLDPPRTGAAAVCELLAQEGPERLVYVSCDAATFARDLKVLAAGSYELKALRALEMFPQTSHVETVALLTR